MEQTNKKRGQGMGTIKKLHLGCGNIILPGFVNLDVRDMHGVNKVAPVYPLDLKINSFDLIYACHVLEHFPLQMTTVVLTDWVRVLKKNGKIRISVPDFNAMIQIYQVSNDIECVAGPICGGQDYPQNFHYAIFDEQKLRAQMSEAGLTAIHSWDFKREDHGKIWDFSQAETCGIPISLNLEGRKA